MGRSLVSTLHDESVEGDIAEISVVVEEEFILHRILLYAQVELGVGDKSERFFGVELLQIPILSAIFFSFTKKPLAASNMSVLSIPLLCSILGEPLIVTQTFVRSEYEEDGFPLTHSPTVNNVHVWNFF